MNIINKNIVVLFLFSFIFGCVSTPPSWLLRERALELSTQGESDRSVEIWRELVLRNPGNWSDYYQLGEAELVVGRPIEACSALKIATTLRPSNNEVSDAYAKALFDAGRENDLFSYLENRCQRTRAVRDYLVWAQYALLLNDPDTARLAVDVAVAFEGEQGVESYIFAANLARDLEDRELAIERLKQAYKIDPDNEEVKSMIRDMGEVPGPTFLDNK